MFTFKSNEYADHVIKKYIMKYLSLYYIIYDYVIRIILLKIF